MENNDTKVDTESDVQSKNEVETEGDTNKNVSNEKMLPQSEVDKIVARARSEGKDAGKKDALKAYEGKHVLTDDDLSKMKADWESEYKTKIALDAKRTEYKSKGLTDAQLDAVMSQVEKPEDVDAKVELLFGALLKKTAPVINTGNTNTGDTKDESPNATLNQWLVDDLKKKGYRH